VKITDIEVIPIAPKLATRRVDLYGIDCRIVYKVHTDAGNKAMTMTKRYDHANEERYGAAIEALDAAGKTGSAEAVAAARWKQR